MMMVVGRLIDSEAVKIDDRRFFLPLYTFTVCVITCDIGLELSSLSILKLGSALQRLLVT